MNGFQIWDSHVHIFPPEIYEHWETYAARDPYFGMLTKKSENGTGTEEAWANAEEALHCAELAGVYGLVMQGWYWNDIELMYLHNDYMAQAIKNHPQRLKAFASINPMFGKEAISEIERCVSLGFCGIGELGPGANGFDFQLNFKYGKHPTFDSSDKEYVYWHNGNMISVKDINCNMYLSLDYNALNTSILYDDLLLTTKEVDTINNLKFGDSISKLYEKSLIYKASAISKIYYANDNLGNPKYSLYPCITFVIDKKGQTYKTIDISVSDGKISKICEPIEHKKEYETGFNFFIQS